MSSFIPRVAAVHDMSCIGRCSLTVIMPILSCMGVQVCPLPTAVLSTHLGGFSKVVFTDFTDKMPGYFKHWKDEGIDFNCIYSGFLASEKQIDEVCQFIDEFSANKPLVLVDPVMGDEGKLYSVYNADMQERIKELVRKADIITPNYTEACFLLGKPYSNRIDDTKKIRKWLLELADFGPSMVVMTGIPLGNDHIMNIGYDKSAGGFWEVINPAIHVRYPGTGDIFASVLIGCLLQQYALHDAMKRAADFVVLCIKATIAANTPAREGVLLEKSLPWLCK